MLVKGKALVGFLIGCRESLSVERIKRRLVNLSVQEHGLTVEDCCFSYDQCSGSTTVLATSVIEGTS